MTRLSSIQRSAPPLLVSSRPSPRAPAVRGVSREASAYVARWGREASGEAPQARTELDAVYPSDAWILRSMAPAEPHSPAAAAFCLASRLSPADVYPDAAMAGEAPPTLPWWRRWLGTGAGLVVGGALAAPLGMLLLPAVVLGGTLGGGVDVVRGRLAA